MCGRQSTDDEESDIFDVSSIELLYFDFSPDPVSKSAFSVLCLRPVYSFTILGKVRISADVASTVDMWPVAFPSF